MRETIQIRSHFNPYVSCRSQCCEISRSNKRKAPPAQTQTESCKKQKICRHICKTHQCDNQANRDKGHCSKCDPHDKGICVHQEFNELIHRNKLCERHNPDTKSCATVGCTNLAYTRNRCRSHDPKHQKCDHAGCNSMAHTKRGLCKKHDPKYGICKEDGCIKQAKTLKGMCKEHDPKFKKCKVTKHEYDSGEVGNGRCNTCP